MNKLKIKKNLSTSRLEDELFFIYKKFVKKINYKVYSEVADLQLGRKKMIAILKMVNDQYKINIIIGELNENYSLTIVLDLIKEEFIKKQLRKAKKKQYIPLAPEKKHYELSHAQKRLWVLYKMKPNSAYYNVNQAWKIEGALDVVVFKKSINNIILRHDILRTNFIEIRMEPAQIIKEKSNFKLNILGENNDIKIEEIIKIKNQKSFNLKKDSLVRMTLVRKSKNEYILINNFHHIVADFSSLDIFNQELFKNYYFLKRNKKPNFSELSIQYKDYAEWEKKNEKEKNIKAQKKYWMKELGGELPQLKLPIDKSRPIIQTYNGGLENLILEQKIAKKLKNLAQDNSTTLFVVLLAIFNILFHRITGQDDIIVGTLRNNRNYPELENSIGYFSNNLAIRSRIYQNESFVIFLKKIKNKILFAIENSDVAFEYLIEELNLERDSSNSPIFNVLFRLFNFDKSNSEKIPDLNLKLISTEHSTTHFDLMPTVVELPHGLLDIKFIYNTDLFYSATVRQFLQIFKTLIIDILDKPEQEIGSFKIVSADEKDDLEQNFNCCKANYPQNKTIQEQFEKQVRITPDRVAVKLENDNLTYQELNIQANKLANHLIKKCKLKPGHIVALVTERTPKAIVAIFAILKSGGVYLPIDPGYPQKRINYMLKQSRAKIVLVDDKNKKKVEKIISNENILNINSKNLLNNQKIGNPKCINKSTDLAYIIYTSGSTGEPKGAEMQHRAVLNTLFWLQDKFKLNKNDIIAQKTALSFTDSVWELFWTLINGATLSIISDRIVRDPRQFVRRLKQDRITYTQFVPALMTVFLGSVKKTGTKKILPDLKFIFNGGEALSPVLANRWYKKFPNVRIANIYGTTESAIYATNYIVPKKSDENQASVSLGKPIANTKLYILDKNNQVCPLGAPGEIAISGKGLSRGYFNKPGVTKQTYINHPENKERLYKTGDMGKIDYKYNLQYLGRKDQQIQIRGYRVEVGEIETYLKKLHGILECVVIMKLYSAKSSELVVFFTKKNAISVKMVRNSLMKYLPAYMIPKYIISLSKFPLNVHGKIDRKALDKHSLKADNLLKQKKLEGEIELSLGAIWGEMLGIDNINQKDNFFRIGGHSLSAIDMLHQINNKFKIEIFLEDIYNNLELYKLAKIIENKIKKKITKN
ncbi:MAG: non-ribosomal peptide synthetase [Promethearchaeota archaeon]